MLFTLICDTFPDDVTKTCPCNVYPFESHFYSKIGVCRGIPIFLTFALKHRLCTRVPTIYVLSKNKKTFNISELKIFNFQSSENLCLLPGQVFVMINKCGVWLVYYGMPQMSYATKAILNICRKIQIRHHKTTASSKQFYIQRILSFKMEPCATITSRSTIKGEETLVRSGLSFRCGCG